MAPLSPISEADFQRILATEGKRELLRQSRWSYNLYAFLMASSIIVGVSGAALLLMGKTTEGAFTAVMGLGSGAACTQLSKDSQEKMAIFIQQLEHPALPSRG